MLYAVLAVVIVVVVILALLFSGAIPGFSLTGAGGGGGGGGGGRASYNVTFSESGLPGGASWSVTLGGATKTATAATVTFQEHNGTYAWTASAAGYRATPGSGSLIVSGGDRTQGIVFAALPPGSYSVTFSESGLPSGTSWSVTFNGTTSSSTTTSLGFTSGNGTWPFSVGAVTGYTASPSSGHVTVAGGPTTQGIQFTSSGGGGGGGQDSFSQALPLAAGKAPATSFAVYAAGIDSTVSWTNSSTPGLNASCEATGGTGAWPTLSAYTGNYHNGYLSGWVFFYYTSAPSLSLIWVAGSTATLIGTITGSNCLADYSYATGVGSVVDSPQVASAIAANASTFIASHSTASAIYAAVSGASLFGFTTYPLWIVTYTTCTANGGGTGDNFTAEVNATNGAVISTNTTSGACGPAFGGAPTTSGSPRSLDPELRTRE